MKKKKVLVHGTPESLKKFFADAISHDYEVVAILSEESGGKISFKRNGKEIEILSSQSLPKFVKNLIDAIIITDTDTKDATFKFFRKQGFYFSKIIFWNETNGWDKLEIKAKDGTRVIFINGMEINVRDKNDERFLSETMIRLRNNRIYKNMDPKRFESALKEHFQKVHGKPIDFNNVKTFIEKLQWLKLYDSTPLKSRLTDKFLVRNWVGEKIGSQYLIPLLGVWDNFDDIDFDALPDQFVLKCNHGSGMNVIVRDKKTFNRLRVRERINAWLSFDYGMNVCLELHYSRIKRKVIAEKFMQDGVATNLGNYRFWCFNSKPVFCGVDDGNLADLRIDYFDMNWQPNGFENANHPNSEHPERISPPKNFELMKELAAKLAEGFAFVRVDFYEIEGRVYFGEMTFTPGGGDFSFKSEGTDEYLGSLLKLPVSSAPPHVLILRHKRKFTMSLPLILNVHTYFKRLDKRNPSPNIDGGFFLSL